MISITDLVQKIFSYKKVGLICHMRPDGDTLGSALALSLAMQKKGIDASVYCSDLVPERFSFLPQVKQVSNNLAGNFDALIAIDCADITRLGELDEQFLSHKETFVIDHHISNTRYAKTNYVNDLSSNCELMYNVITSAGVEIDDKIATLGGDEQERGRRLDVLSYQINEIETVALQDGEEEELLAKRNKINNIEKIITALKEATAAFTEENGALDALRFVKRAISSIERLDEEYASAYARLEDLYSEAEDLTTGDSS